MAADLAHAHAARIHRDNLVVEVGESPLILRDQLRIKHPQLRSRGIDSVIFDVPVRTDFFEWPLRRLAPPSTRSPSRCSSSSAFRIPLRQCLLEVVKQAVLRKHFIRIAAGKQLLPEVLSRSPCDDSPLSIIIASRTKFPTVPPAMRPETVFLSVRPIVQSLARSTMPSSTTLLSSRRNVQRARPFSGLGARQGDQLGFLLAVENRSDGRCHAPLYRLNTLRSPYPPVACVPGRSWTHWCPRPR